MDRPFPLSWREERRKEEEEEEGAVCMCGFPPPLSISVIKNHTGRVRAAEAVATATGERAALEATQSTGGKLHIVFAHEIQRCVMTDFCNQSIRCAQVPLR